MPHKYDGAGAGLAIARKIIQSHGGDIRIDSVPGQGTSVLFSIQKKIKRSALIARYVDRRL